MQAEMEEQGARDEKTCLEGPEEETEEEGGGDYGMSKFIF